MSRLSPLDAVNVPAKPFLPVLGLFGVAHRYGRVPTFSDLDLALASGEICCLLGPSGCGKTTALRCIAGFERIAAGSISIDGNLSPCRGRHVPPSGAHRHCSRTCLFRSERRAHVAFGIEAESSREARRRILAA